MEDLFLFFPSERIRLIRSSQATMEERARERDYDDNTHRNIHLTNQPTQDSSQLEKRGETSNTYTLSRASERERKKLVGKGRME